MRWLLPILMLSACTGVVPPKVVPAEDDTDLPDEVDGTPVSLTISPGAPILEAGDAVQLVAEGWLSNGRRVDLSDEVAWRSEQGRVAEVTPEGLLSALAEGEAEIVATWGGALVGSARLTVLDADNVLQSVRILPDNITLGIGDTVTLSAEGTFSDGVVGDITASCLWSSNRENVATVDLRGRVEAVAAGVATLSADCGDGFVAQSGILVDAEEVAPSLPNLVVSAVTPVVSGNDATFVVAVTNNGSGLADSAFVDVFFDSGEPEEGELGETYAFVGALGAGDTVQVSLTVPDVGPGDHEVWFYADVDDWIEETNEDDNVFGPLSIDIDAPVVASGPDLVVTQFVGTSDGDFSFYTVAITNVGDAWADEFWVDIWLDRDDDPAVCDYGDEYAFVETLAPDDTWWWEPEVDLGPGTGETWTTVLFADSCDDVDEANEDDNLATASVSQ